MWDTKREELTQGLESIPDELTDFQDDFTPDEKKRILNAVKNLDEGKKVYHDLIEVD